MSITYAFRLVLLGGRFAEHIVLPASNSLIPQDFFNITVASGVTPVEAAQQVLRGYNLKLPESAITTLQTSPEQGLVLLAALSQLEIENLPLLHAFEVQRTDGALARAWSTGRMAKDFLSLLGQSRTAYESLLSACARHHSEQRTAALSY